MKRVHVRPLLTGQWEVCVETGWQSFLRDLWRYGPGVALHNVIWLWRHRHDRTVKA